MVDYIGACPICHGNRAAYPQAPSGQQAEPTVPWRCFHCDATFTDSAEAQDHFGRSEYSQPACQIDAKEYRAMEERMRRYNDEDSDLHRTMYGMQADHSQALMREEEKGYARGLKDGQAIAGQQSERPAPAGQAVVIRALTMARHALVNLRINKSAESLALANALDEALAGQQSERPAGQAVEALTKAREFVKSRKAPGYDGPCMDAIRNIDTVIATLTSSKGGNA